MLKLSIILPSLRENNLSECLRSIHANSSIELEIIVVGKFEPLFLLGNWWDIEGLDVKYIEDDKCIGTTYAIQKGLEQATGEYIVTLSDDAIVCPHWDKHMINFLEKQDNSVPLIGNFNIFDATGFLGQLGYYNIPFSPFPIIKRKDIEKINLYYSTDFYSFYSDPFLGITLYEKGGRIINCKEALIYHSYNPDILHLNNKSKYWQHDEEVFKKKCKHLGEFTGCQHL